MRHYEIVFLVHPDQSAQVPAMIDRYKSTVEDAGGKIHRLEDWGRRHLAYPIKKFREGSYVYLELSGEGEMVTALENFFKVNDTIIRYLTVKAGKKKPVKPAQVQPIAEEAAKQVPEEGKTDESTTKPSVTGAE